MKNMIMLTLGGVIISGRHISDGQYFRFFFQH